ISEVSGPSTIRDNRVYHNSSIGLNTSYGSTVTGNIVYSNGIGIQGYSTATFRNNLVYANTSLGVNLSNGSGGVFDSNTVYQTTGDALDLSGGLSGFTSRDNILVALAGYPVSVAADSESGFSSDYNDLFVSVSAPLLHWGGQQLTTRSSLYYE